MSEAPKEIWCSTGLYWDYKEDWSEGSWSAQPELSNVKYIRADRIEELEAKLAKAVDALQVIEDASRFFARDRESANTETLSYAHETTRRLCSITLAELKGEK